MAGGPETPGRRNPLGAAVWSAEAVVLGGPAVGEDEECDADDQDDDEEGILVFANQGEHGEKSGGGGAVARN